MELSTSLQFLGLLAQTRSVFTTQVTGGAHAPTRFGCFGGGLDRGGGGALGRGGGILGARGGMGTSSFGGARRGRSSSSERRDGICGMGKRQVTSCRGFGGRVQGGVSAMVKFLKGGEEAVVF